MNIIVVGGGAAGMMAACVAAKKGADVCLIDRNEKLGKKVYITGKGRCNLTNACDMETLFGNIVTNSKFMYSSLYGFSNIDTMDYFEALGLRIKTERGDRVFPESDHSSDVIRVLERQLKELGVSILLNTRVHSLIENNGVISGVRLYNGKEIKADRVILATGGKSYPSCGADGDSYRFAKELGITVKEPEPSLVPFVTKEDWVKDLQGLSLKNVNVTLIREKKKIYDGFGEMLFTHFGISGPLILSASSYCKEEMYGNNLKLYIDLKPALTQKQLDDRILRDFEEAKNKQLINALNKLLPSKLIPVIIELAGIDPRKKVNIISKEERNSLVMTLKNLSLTIIGNRGFNEAIITRGGINVKEVNPTTMESKRIKRLYFAGEMLDVDALTGGFNLQIAWSSGYAAGEASAELVE